MKQEIAQGVVYRRGPSGLEFLVIKRVPDDGGFWQAMTGTIDSGEDALTTLKRELIEETGISEPIYISELLEDYNWENVETGVVGRDQVFAVEVDPSQVIVIDPNEHDDFKWLPLDAALQMLKYDGNKNSMRIVADHAVKK